MGKVCLRKEKDRINIESGLVLGSGVWEGAALQV